MTKAPPSAIAATDVEAAAVTAQADALVSITELARARAMLLEQQADLEAARLRFATYQGQKAGAASQDDPLFDMPSGPSGWVVAPLQTLWTHVRHALDIV